MQSSMLNNYRNPIGPNPKPQIPKSMYPTKSGHREVQDGSGPRASIASLCVQQHVPLQALKQLKARIPLSGSAKNRLQPRPVLRG